MTNTINSILLFTVLHTNWLSMTLPQPKGDGTTTAREVEIGIIESNRFAVVVADGTTNRILISSQALPPPRFFIRDREKPGLFTTTNWIFPPSAYFYITNFGTNIMSLK